MRLVVLLARPRHGPGRLLLLFSALAGEARPPLLGKRGPHHRRPPGPGPSVMESGGPSLTPEGPGLCSMDAAGHMELSGAR